MDPETESKARARAWRDPLSAGFRAHQNLLLLRLRWRERRAAVVADRLA
ncbi:hypothetical protein [Mycolicibacterium holsaticum]|nr:hypothetical protein [Mycolicibacterium holsaticum]QZA14277.1 hypothetical protein K3U96_09315 [Mycolicibacterium holsaticum DSM 44478 = JCM 12374]UNC08272.1 hypothetical protein H5U41_17515 [Mycolicibacterium holsaticum DSM 44478 = JCM 12374]